MNERIRELEKQSVFYNEETEKWELNLEKFAELIVRECANIASMNDDDTLSEGDIGTRSIKRQIKEHFALDK